MKTIEEKGEMLREKLGLTKAPVVMDGLQTTAVFFEKELGLDPSLWISYLRGIDYHCAVTMEVLQGGTEVVRHKPAGGRPKPFVYFTRVGESPMRTGTNFPNVAFERFMLSLPIRVLKSTASSISFDPQDRVSRPGGAAQYIVAVRNFASLRKL